MLVAYTLNLNVAVEMTRKILSAAKNAKHAKNQKFLHFQMWTLDNRLSPHR